MQVLLVNPDYEIERYMGRHFGRMGWVMPPMGLLYLAAELEHEGVEVEVYDAQIERRSLATALTEAGPEIVGITCATALVGSTLAAARLIKEVLPSATVVVGGVHPTVRPDDLVSDPGVDVAVRGEGLRTIVEICRAVDAGDAAELRTIAGTSHRLDGELVNNPSRPLEPDVDAFPFPARHLVPMEIYRMSPDLSIRPPMDIVFGAYGCPYDCVFCAAQTVMGGSFRARSLDNIFAEIDRVVREQKPRTLLMGDDNFVLSRGAPSTSATATPAAATTRPFPGRSPPGSTRWTRRSSTPSRRPAAIWSPSASRAASGGSSTPSSSNASSAVPIPVSTSDPGSWLVSSGASVRSENSRSTPEAREGF